MKSLANWRFPRPTRRGLIEANQLQRLRRLPCRISAPQRGAASLKRMTYLPDFSVFGLFPRPTRRGLIEALKNEISKKTN